MNKVGILFIVLGISLFIILMISIFKIDISVCEPTMRRDLLAFCRIGVISIENNLLLMSAIFAPSILLATGTFILMKSKEGNNE